MITGKNQHTRREVCPSTTFFHQKSCMDCPKTNSNKRGEKPANNLSYGVTSSLNLLLLHGRLQGPMLLSGSCHHYMGRPQVQMEEMVSRQGGYNGISSKKSPSFCMITFSASLINLTVIHPLSNDGSYCVDRRYLHLHRTHCRYTLIYPHVTSPNLPTCEISLSLLTLPASEAGDLV